MLHIMEPVGVQPSTPTACICSILPAEPQQSLNSCLRLLKVPVWSLALIEFVSSDALLFGFDHKRVVDGSTAGVFMAAVK